MNQYETMKSALLSNPNVKIVKEYSSRHTLSKGKVGPVNGEEPPFIVESIDFLVAPTRGVYNPSRLQDFMHEIVPGLTPTKIKDFKKEVGLLRYGQLIYEEPVGSGTIISDGDGQYVLPLVGSYARRITITLYPNEIIARKSNSGRIPYPNRHLGNMGNIRLSQLCEFLKRKVA